MLSFWFDDAGVVALLAFFELLLELLVVDPIEAATAINDGVTATEDTELEQGGVGEDGLGG